jgi:hypothetical protein
LALTPPGAAEFVICDHTIEAFIQDWKSYEGWNQLTKQPGAEGACQSVILSLLVDHALFVHNARAKATSCSSPGA